MLSCFEHENRFITLGPSMYLGKQIFRKVISSKSTGISRQKYFSKMLKRVQSNAI